MTSCRGFAKLTVIPRNFAQSVRCCVPPSLSRHGCAPAVRQVKNNVAADIYSDKAAREGEERARVNGMRKERRGASRPIGGDSRTPSESRELKDEVESRRRDTRVARKADKERNREDCNCVTCLL